MFDLIKKSIKKVCFITLCIILTLPQASLCSHKQLANEDKKGLHVTTIEDVLQLSPDEVDLATAALIVSEYWSDLVQGRMYLSRLDEMALEIRERMRKKRLKPNYKAIPVINKYLFSECRFSSVSEATDPNDLFLHTVLDKKRGYCLSLSILYLSLGERLGIPLYGVVVPGHFFVRYDDGRTKLNIETTSMGGSAIDKHYINKFKVPESINSIYMKNLNKIETLGCFFNNLGNSYIDIGDTDLAFLALLRAVQINPTLPESRANLGNIYLKKNQIEDAIVEYRTALQINPSDPKTHNNLGSAYSRLGWFKDAINQYEKAITLDPNFIDAYKNLARAYSNEQKFAQAIDQLRKAISLNPKDTDCHSQLGDIYCQMGKYNEAISKYKTALIYKPDLADAHYGLGICYNKLGLSDDEIHAYQMALAIKPDLLPALINLGNAFFRKENYNAAIEQYKKAVLIEPNDGLIHYNLGAAYAQKQNYELAVLSYQKAIELESEMGDAHYGLAFGFYKLQKYELALKHLQIAEKLGVKVTKEQFDAIKNMLK